MEVATRNPHLQNPANESTSFKQLTIDQNKNRDLLVCDLTPNKDYPTYLARATNDAVRDWDVTTGGLLWHEGLQSLFGYDSQPAGQTISFWDEHLHPADQARITASIGETLSSDAQQW